MKMAQLVIRGLFRNLKMNNVLCSVSGVRRYSGKGDDGSAAMADKGSLTLEETVDFSIHGPSPQGIQGGHDQYLEISEPQIQTNIVAEANEREVAETLNCHGSVNLYSSMQSNVPDPCDVKIEFAEHFNMPGGGGKLYDKYIQEVQIASHPRDK